jgi:hypothetical protein
MKSSQRSQRKNMQLQRIRTTSLSLYDSCPYCFYLKQSGVKEPEIPAFKFGTLVHSAVEEYAHGRSIQSIVEKYGYDVENYVSLYAEQYAVIPCETEVKFALPLFDTDVILTGHLDQIYGDWLMEHKTSSSKYTQEDVDRQRQVTAYSWAYRQLYGKPEAGIRFNIFIKNKKPILQCLDTYRTEEDYKEWEEWVRDILDNIKNDRFDPKPARFHIYSLCPMSLQG